jgi:hypothetical protein
MASAFESACLQSRIPVASLREIRLRDLVVSDVAAPTIVFVHAEWSGPSRASWILLTRVLAELPTLPSVLVADSDDLRTEEDHAFFRRLGDRPGGWGETYWIRNGRVIERLAKYPKGWRQDDADAFVRQATQRLMSPDG